MQPGTSWRSSPNMPGSPSSSGSISASSCSSAICLIAT
jgi:hypothetical protein